MKTIPLTKGRETIVDMEGTMSTKAIAQDMPRTEIEMEHFKREVREIVNLLGTLIFMPAIILIGFCYGIRAGVIVGFEKTLAMLKGWGK